MACQELNAGLAEASRPAGSLALSTRPAGALAQVARMAADGFCRAFSFVPPVPVESSNLQTFAGEDMVTFSGDQLVTF